MCARRHSPINVKMMENLNWTQILYVKVRHYLYYGARSYLSESRYNHFWTRYDEGRKKNIFVVMESITIDCYFICTMYTYTLCICCKWRIFFADIRFWSSQNEKHWMQTWIISFMILDFLHTFEDDKKCTIVIVRRLMYAQE